MGYTHYWRRVMRPFPKKLWDSLVKDIHYAYEHLPKQSYSSGGYYPTVPLIIGDPDGNDNGNFELGDKGVINFNGVGEYAHENFMLPRDYRLEYSWQLYADKYRKINPYISDEKIQYLLKERFKSENMLYYNDNLYIMGSCKTARKPYDFFVQIVLLLAEANLNRDGKKRIEISSDGDMKDWNLAFEFVLNNYPKHKKYLMKLKLEILTGKREW